MTSENMDVRAEGTLHKEKDKMYWFTTSKLVGKEVVINSAMTIFRDLAGRDLTGFEKGLVLALPRRGTSSVTVLTTWAIDSSASDHIDLIDLKSIKRETCAYVIRTRGSSPYQNVDPIGTHAVYTPDGELVGQVTKTYHPEPGLETPFLDPIDIISGGLSPFVKKAVSKLAARVASRVTARSGAAGLTVKLSPEQYAKALSHVFPSHSLNSTASLIDGVGANAASAVVKDTKFLAAWARDDMKLAGTLFHSAAAKEIRQLPPNSIPSGWKIAAEKTLKSGKGGGRADVFLEGPAGQIIEIDWKTTGRSAFSSKAVNQMEKHSGQIRVVGPVNLSQESRSWIDYVRAFL